MAQSSVTRALDRWIEHQDESFARAASSPRAWLTSSLFVCLFLPALSYAPGARDYFGLRMVPALVCYAPCAVVGVAFAFWHRGERRFSRKAWLIYAADCVLVQFFCASLMVWGSPHGAAALSSLLIFAAAYHGHLLRVTPGEPFVAVGTGLAVVAAALLDAAGDRVQLFAFAGVAALTAELLVGTNAARWEVARRRADQLHAALSAQMLEQQDREVKRLSDTLVDVLARNHDLNNALMALRLNADALAIECQQQGVEGVQGVERILAALRDGVERVSAIAEGIKVTGRAEGAAPPPAELVDVLAVLDAVLPAVRARFPGVAQELSVDRGQPMRAAVRGGEVALRRVVENLLINACEGDGVQAAHHVEVRVFRDPSGGCVKLVVSDDGPGFRPEQLGGEVAVFRSTKPQGTGLGLYTCERLLRASGGVLERANLPSGGAQLAAILPLGRT